MLPPSSGSKKKLASKQAACFSKMMVDFNRLHSVIFHNHCCESFKFYSPEKITETDVI
jgi:hypothetical protein